MSAGRKSAAALATVQSSVVSAIKRPVNPSDLTDEQALEWRAIVSRMPADWFPRETHGLLAQYCRHVVASRRVAQLVTVLEAGDEISITEYDQLLKMQEREGRAMSSLATRMRISQHAQYNHKKKTGTVLDQPWEK